MDYIHTHTQKEKERSGVFNSLERHCNHLHFLILQKKTQILIVQKSKTSSETVKALSLYYRGRRRRTGTAVSGSGLPVQHVPPAGLNTALLLIWVQDRRSSCSGTPTRAHRSLNRASSRPTRTSLRPLTHTQPHVTIYPFRGV